MNGPAPYRARKRHLPAEESNWKQLSGAIMRIMGPAVSAKSAQEVEPSAHRARTAPLGSMDFNRVDFDFVAVQGALNRGRHLTFRSARVLRPISAIVAVL
jgi:hypothetical protein